MELLYYFLILSALIIIAFICRKIYLFKGVVYFLNISLAFIFFLLILELTLLLFFRIKNHYWLNAHPGNENVNLFDESFYTVVKNKVSASVSLGGITYTHNKEGYRDSNWQEKEGRIHIVALGGSTTYGVGVDNSATWPHLLDLIVGGDTVVYNMATPGHSTIENIITAALYLEDLHPDIILLHVGLNDMRVSNVENLAHDYSNFHAPDMYGNMGQCYLEKIPRLATAYYTVKFFQWLDLYPVCAFHAAKFHGSGNYELDSFALELYRKHLGMLLHICKRYTKEVLVLPQVLLKERIENDSLKWWIPYVSKEHLLSVMAAYNMVSFQVASMDSSDYLMAIDRHPWSANDFADPSHLNAAGNAIFARIVAEELKALPVQE